MNGVIVPVLNNEILDEYQDVLSRPKFAFSEQIVKNLVSEIDNAGIHIDAEPIDIELDDPDDLVFYEVVMDARKNDDAYLVTGNIKHFPEKPFIVTPRQMIELILKSMK